MPLARPQNARRPTETSDLSWRADAACKDTDLDLWFGPADFEHPEARAARESVALRICGRCEVREACLDWHLTTKTDDGVAGGMVADDRRRLRRAYQRERKAS